MRTTGHSWLGQNGHAFARTATMSQITGLDNSVSLPPYFPVFRGEDLLFGTMLRYLFPVGVVLDYDWGIPHLQLVRRPLDGNDGSSYFMLWVQLVARTAGS